MKDLLTMLKAVGIVVSFIIMFYVAIVATYIIVILVVIYIIYKLLQADTEEPPSGQ